MVPGWIVIVSFTMAMIGATVENVSTMPNRRRMMFCGFENYVFTRLYLFTELSAPFIKNMDAVFLSRQMPYVT